MDIMHITIQSFQGQNNEGWIHPHTKIRLGESNTVWVEFYTDRPIQFFCMPMWQIPAITPPQLGKLLDQYRMHRGMLAYRKGLRHGEMLQNGSTPEAIR